MAKCAAMNDPDVVVIDAGAAPQVPGTFLTVPEAAAASGLADRTIRRALSEGRLAGANIGGRWSVDPADLARFGRMARRRHGTGTVPPGAGAANNEGAQRGTAGEPVPDGAALVLASDVAALVVTVDTLTSRLEAAEGEIAALRDALAAASGSRRSWWSRMFGGGGGDTSTPGTVADEIGALVDLAQAREDRADRAAA